MGYSNRFMLKNYFRIRFKRKIIKWCHEKIRNNRERILNKTKNIIINIKFYRDNNKINLKKFRRVRKHGNKYSKSLELIKTIKKNIRITFLRRHQMARKLKILEKKIWEPNG
jgi:hypothetical protein